MCLSGLLNTKFIYYQKYSSKIPHSLNSSFIGNTKRQFIAVLSDVMNFHQIEEIYVLTGDLANFKIKGASIAIS